MARKTSKVGCKTNKTGFSIIEALIAVVLVGIAVTALVASNGYLSQANGAGADLSTAEFLIEQIRELTTMLPVVDPQTETATFGAEETNLSGYDDVDDFNNITFSPPITASRTTLNDLSAFTQTITVQNVSASNFNQAATPHSTNFVRITVTISMNSKTISSASWLRARY